MNKYKKIQFRHIGKNTGTIVREEITESYTRLNT